MISLTLFSILSVETIGSGFLVSSTFGVGIIAGFASTGGLLAVSVSPFLAFSSFSISAILASIFLTKSSMSTD